MSFYLTYLFWMIVLNFYSSCVILLGGIILLFFCFYAHKKAPLDKGWLYLSHFSRIAMIVLFLLWALCRISVFHIPLWLQDFCYHCRCCEIPYQLSLFIFCVSQRYSEKCHVIINWASLFNCNFLLMSLPCEFLDILTNKNIKVTFV
jgi:hypothetical protein